jgi:hypothetical protein
MTRQRILLAATCALACVTTAAPARADWGPTHWGDSIDTVIASVGDGIAAKPGDHGDRVFNQDLRAEREGDFHGLAARYQFYVGRKGGLSLIRVTPKDEAHDCNAFAEAARNDLGEPWVKKRENLVGTVIDTSQWRDREANLAIQMSEFSGSMFVTQSCLLTWQRYGSGKPGVDN